MADRADELIELLGLERHPEGGWYTETFRAAAEGRPASTAIFALWRRGERSHWHRVVDADEIWHHYEGGPFVLRTSTDGVEVTEQVLGPDVGAGERHQLVVPAGVWQAGEPLRDFTLIGCTVSPGFVWESFELAEPDWVPGP